MLAGEDEPGHPRRLDSPYPLAGVQAGGAEDSRVLCPVSPFPAGVGVQRKMNKSVKFHLLQGKLPLAGPYRCQTLVELMHVALSFRL